MRLRSGQGLGVTWPAYRLISAFLLSRRSTTVDSITEPCPPLRGHPDPRVKSKITRRGGHDYGHICNKCLTRVKLYFKKHFKIYKMDI
jgi:hypothetical protein